MAKLSPDVLDDAARRIERWLLVSDVQLPDGAHRGGVAGWLDAEGQPAFVYLEITGYYLTAMAWLLAGGARSDEATLRANQRGRQAVAWVHSAVSCGRLPPTRIHLRAGTDDDWRNRADFSFDLAMAIRGLVVFADVAGDEDGRAAAARDFLAARLAEIRSDYPLLPSHRLRNGTPLPERWSTQRGPHHLKAAAVLLSARLNDGLLPVSKATFSHWADQLRIGWPVAELHALLYGLEGLALAEERELDRVEDGFRRIMQMQRPDGSLPADLGRSTSVRSDVLAQALRVGALLRASRRLREEAWAERLERLAERLLGYVRPDGSVGFAAHQGTSNAWCAMFAYQALVLHRSGDPAMATLVRRYLI